MPILSSVALIWDESLATGFADIDEQHKHLFEIANRFLGAMAKGMASEKVDRTLKDLEDYTRVHFGLEERCMLRHQCPSAGCNQKEHAEFISKLRDVRRRLDTAGPSAAMAIEVQQMMNTWLRSHITRVDSQLRDSA